MSEKTVTRMRRAGGPKAEKPEITPAAKPIETLHWFGEPKRICGNCQHFKPSEQVKHVGDCHNLISGRWRSSDGEPACQRGFYPACDRWPIERLYGNVSAEAGGGI
jgi:hypothetical protein